MLLEKSYVRFLLVTLFGKIRYLRWVGARVGESCEILTKASNFGSEPWLVQVGNKVTVADGVKFVTHDASSRLFRGLYPEMSRFGNKFGAISIEDDVFIGVNSIILPGVKIGAFSVVGAGSVVTKDVPPRSVVAGVPARVVMSLDEYIEKFRKNMIAVSALTKESLRTELTTKFWGEAR